MLHMVGRSAVSESVDRDCLLDHIEPY